MAYDAQTDTYTCANGKLLQKTQEKKTHTASGLEITTSVYECSECDGCPLKEKCIRACGSKNASGRTTQVIYVSNALLNTASYGSKDFLPKGLPASGEPFYSGRRQLCIREAES